VVKTLLEFNLCIHIYMFISFHDQSSYQVQWLSLIQDIERKRFLHKNASVTLKFDLLTSNFIGIIYWPCPIFLPSTMAITYKLFKILSWHCFCIKCYCDLDIGPTDLKMYKGHLLNMTNLRTKYNDCHS